MKIYITGEQGPINDYSTIRSEPSFVVKVYLPDDSNPLDYVWNGNEAVYDEFVPEKPALTEIEQLQQENKELKERQDMTDAAMLELADVVFGGGE